MEPPEENRFESAQRALRRQEAGYGTTNSEKRLIADYNKGRIGRDHFEQIHVAPLPEPKPRRSIRTADMQNQIGQGRDSIGQKVDDPVPYSPPAPTTYTFTGCVSGVPKNFDVVITAGPY